MTLWFRRFIHYFATCTIVFALLALTLYHFDAFMDPRVDWSGRGGSRVAATGYLAIILFSLFMGICSATIGSAGHTLADLVRERQRPIEKHEIVG